MRRLLTITKNLKQITKNWRKKILSSKPKYQRLDWQSAKLNKLTMHQEVHRKIKENIKTKIQKIMKTPP